MLSTTFQHTGFDPLRLDGIKQRIRSREHIRYRRRSAPNLLPELEGQGLSWPRRAARLIRRMCEAEDPIIEREERIVYTRTTLEVPPIYSVAEWQRVTAGRTLHELGPINNICADWGMVLSQGLLGRKQVALETRARMAADPAAVEFLDSAIETIDAVLALAAHYREAASRAGRHDVAEILARVPAYPSRTLHEALQALRLVHAVLWLGGHYQCGLGRFDQYLWPYLAADLAVGRLTPPAAEELVAEFFISLNKDSDLYPGVQQGDNGQTIMLGGVRRDGTDGVNELTRIALRAALYSEMIDPKINLRIRPETDMSLLCLTAELTRKGLGFPQYSNDAVVIPALVAHGYDLEDARDYTVAACWEIIIPGRGMEVVNIGAVSLPAAVDRAIRDGLRERDSFEGILNRTDADIRRQVGELVDSYSRLLLPPAPYHSVLMDGCLEGGRDLSAGLKYNNFGIHGAGSANAADALSAVKRLVLDERSVEPSELIAGLDADFEGYEVLRERLLSETPKVGNDPEADELLARLFDLFATACEAVEDNGRGGKIRPGSGSAMYYMWLARGAPGDSVPPIGATADGRKKGDFFSANLAPSLSTLVRGPISVLQAFSRVDYRRVYNGGPITMEIADAAFSDPEAITKCAMLVRTFAQLGCQQLQLNTLDAEKLLDAKRHPERHRNLIVRVWGWSGYFCELSPEYQDHVIARYEQRL
jgi:formate C-acetyltransferase